LTRFIFTLVLIFGSICFADNFDSQSFMLLARSPQLALQQAAPQQSNTTAPSLQRKSPKKGMLLSAVIPGAGQAYNGSYLKAAAFLTTEIVGWALYVTQKSKGNDIEDEFHDYANTNWSEDEYWDWIAKHSNVDRNDIEALRDWEHDNFSHGLHEVKDQQYYEMIGKYDQFNYAWDDSDIGLLDESFTKDQRSAHRLYYEERRDASNKAFKKATTGITIVLFNHIFSALEAGWSLSKNGNKKLNTQLYGDYLKFDQKTVPGLTVRMNW
jgi:hypothetical protein